MRTEVRIVAGSLKGRKLIVHVHPDLRPTPQMAREALFSILGNAVPDRPFVDIFAGTGVVGLEALSRAASSAIFVERDVRLAQDIEGYLRKFNLGRQGRIYRTDAYHWIAAWRPPAEPVNVFLSPPFADLTNRSSDLLAALRLLQEKVAVESVIILQSERGTPLEDHSTFANWEHRRYSRNVLLLWQRGAEGAESARDGDPRTEYDGAPPK
jgi:16S rRNA (guanine(966)-N(2))-methyltransferase RsmD